MLSEQQRVTLIFRLVQDWYGLEDLKVKRRTPQLCAARGVTFALLYENTGLSMPGIADLFFMNHTTVSHGMKKADQSVVFQLQKVFDDTENSTAERFLTACTNALARSWVSGKWEPHAKRLYQAGKIGRKQIAENYHVKDQTVGDAIRRWACEG